MAQVTVDAGTGKAILNFNVADRALTIAQSLASTISSLFGSGGTAYNPASPPPVPAPGGYLYDLSPKHVSIDATGFAAIVVQNSGSPATVIGGGNSHQTVLGSNGGLTFIDSDTNPADGATVVVGGGNNRVTFAGSTGKNAVYAATGSNTLIGGDGDTTIYDGTGQSLITLGGGTSHVDVEGTDQIHLGAGAATISVDQYSLGASATVYGAVSVDDPDTFSLIFSNGSAASKVTGGDGSYSINGGVGGGNYTGGSAGNNVLLGGSGRVTLHGGGDGDYLVGNTGDDKLVAGPGDETLVAASGDRLIAGPGDDSMFIGDGPGISKITLGTGVDTIWATANARVLVNTATATPSGPAGNGHFSMVFVATGGEANTVLGGVGSFYVEAGQGGGVFTGGSAGGNVMFSDGGAVTLYGGGKNDYLSGGADGGNYLVAAKGNTTLVASAGGSDTLAGGTGADTFNLAKEVADKTYTITGYTAKDLLFIDPAEAASATIPGAVHVANGTSTITLSDNTKVTLVGYTGHINIG